MRLLRSFAAGWTACGTIAISVMGLTAFAQSPGIITGRVLTDDGQPAARAAVTAGSAGVNAIRRSAKTDDDGRFQLTDLPEAAYRIFASIPGYVSDASPGESQFHVPGESVSIMLRKGGVITGKVVMPSGEPAIEAAIDITRVRDLEGHPIAPGGPPTIADDRGIYRAYGLVSGIYLVSMSGAGPFGRQSPLSSYLRTYYPSSSRETAVEVTVHAGEEVGGIDIRWRSEQGRTVSGRVNGGSPANALISRISVELVDHATQEERGEATVQFENGQSGFEIRGVADGDYDVLASSGFGGVNDAMYSTPRRLTVKGADVAGIELTLVPSASVSGEVRLDPENSKTCDGKRQLSVQATNFELRRIVSDSSGRALDSPVNRLGQFALNGVRPGRYQLVGYIPEKSVYLRAVSTQAAAASRDLVKEGITLAAGDHLTGVVVTLAAGAAAVTGSVTGGGGRQFRVHLVPKDREKSEQPVFFYEAVVRGDNSFAIEHIAPGSYWVKLKEIKSDEPLDAARVAWDTRDRTKLRAEAEAANVELTLQPCQRISSYSLNAGGRK